MLQIFMALFSMGILGGVIIILGLACLFMVGASTCLLFMELFDELGRPLNFEGKEVLIFVLVVAIVLLILSSLGPICSAIGKSFILSNFILIIMGIFKEMSVRFSITEIIIVTIVSVIVSFKSTDDILDFILECPILSILSAIPASFFIFEYIWLMKEELFGISGGVAILAKESLIITLIIFGIFTAIEIVNLIKN